MVDRRPRRRGDCKVRPFPAFFWVYIVCRAAFRVPLLLSWPAMLPKGTIRNELISLADLFGIATEAAGECDVREGTNVLKMLRGECTRRQYLVGMVEPPGSHDFKLVVVTDEWKYIFM